MTQRCGYCNYKAPNHQPNCNRPRTSAELLAAVHLPSHEEEQHRAAYHRAVHGDGDVCGVASPNCAACGRHHGYGECPNNYVSKADVDKLRAMPGAVVYHLPTDPQARKDVPLASGCLDYFPDALAAVAATSLQGSRQHHPDEPLHWDRSKSGDEADALLRHLVQRGTLDTDGIRHSAKVAWRALALLQKEIEDAAGHGDNPKAA